MHSNLITKFLKLPFNEYIYIASVNDNFKNILTNTPYFKDVHN